MTVEATLLFILAAVAVVVAVRWIAGKTGLPAAALLTLIGILYGFLPGPNIELEPHLILTLVIPPLLYQASLESSLIDIRRNMRTVISLSVALVLATALLVGAGFGLFVAGATLAAGIALGAAIAPPDPVAALAVGRKVGLPGNLVTLIQGEGLLNDATALTILSVAVAAAGGSGFSFPAAVGQFVIAAAGGVLAGWLVAYVVRLLRPIRTDPISSNAISLATPFVAYLLAERVHVSGVLAVVVAGLIIGHNAPRTTTGASRLQNTAVWRLVEPARERGGQGAAAQRGPVCVRTGSSGPARGDPGRTARSRRGSRDREHASPAGASARALPAPAGPARSGGFGRGAAVAAVRGGDRRPAGGHRRAAGGATALAGRGAALRRGFPDPEPGAGPRGTASGPLTMGLAGPLLPGVVAAMGSG